ncbi:MAG TPA: DNA-binding protein [Microbacteriaceae bacterium]|nr:DNA-binding protein [Microbacteriaceae bacterium]
MNAHPNDQKTLLRVRDLDVQLAQLAHQRSVSVEGAELESLAAEDSAANRARLEAHTVWEHARAELTKLESDVALVEARIKRDVELESQVSSAKDASGIEHELASLRERLAILEEAELAAMEAVEAAEATLAQFDAAAAERAARRAELEASRAAALADIDRAEAEVSADRRAIAATVEEALLAEYERRRARSGAGAGLLRQKTCGACSMVLTGVDFERVRQLPADAIATCPECDAILVRTEESGL